MYSFSFLSFLTTHTVPTRCFFFVHQGSKCLIYDGFSQIYLVVTIKICLEFAKMGQSTDKNKLQLSKFWHGAHAHDHHIQTVLALKLHVTLETMINSKFLCYINKV